MTAINHWPVFGSVRLCGDKTGTANGHRSITCPACQSKIAAKVAAHFASAEKETGQRARFLKADAENWQSILHRTA